MKPHEKDQEDHCMEMTESALMDHNHQSAVDPVKQQRQTKGPNSGYDSDQAEDIASLGSKTDLNRPGGPYCTSGPVKHDPLPPPQGSFYRFVNRTQNNIYSFWSRHKKIIKRLVLLLLLIGYFVYLTFAILRDVKDATGLIVATVLFCLYFTYKLLLARHWEKCRIPCCHREWWQASRTKARLITAIKW